jgi:hypothetical protein
MQFPRRDDDLLDITYLKRIESITVIHSIRRSVVYTREIESTLPVVFKTYLRNLIEKRDNRVEDIKGTIMQNFALSNAIRFLDEASRSPSLDITLQTKYTQVLESLRSQMPTERAGFISNMNINNTHIQNMVVNGHLTPAAAEIHTPSLLEYGERPNEVRYYIIT